MVRRMICMVISFPKFLTASVVVENYYKILQTFKICMITLSVKRLFKQKFARRNRPFAYISYMDVYGFALSTRWEVVVVLFLSFFLKKADFFPIELRSHFGSFQMHTRKKITLSDKNKCKWRENWFLIGIKNHFSNWISLYQ